MMFVVGNRYVFACLGAKKKSDVFLQCSNQKANTAAGLKGSSSAQPGLCYLKANNLSGASRYGNFFIPVVLIKSQRKESNLFLFQPHKVILIQSYAWILQRVVSVSFRA